MSESTANASQSSPRPLARAATLFPGRRTLYLADVAQALKKPTHEIVALIEGEKLSAVTIVDTLPDKTEATLANTPASTWRVPADAYDEFILRNAVGKAT